LVERRVKIWRPTIFSRIAGTSVLVVTLEKARQTLILGGEGVSEDEAIWGGGSAVEDPSVGENVEDDGFEHFGVFGRPSLKENNLGSRILFSGVSAQACSRTGHKRTEIIQRKNVTICIRRRQNRHAK